MRRWVYSVLALAAAAGVCAPPADAQQDRKKKKIVLPPNSFYSLGSKTLEGQPIGLTDFAGQVALVVNLASRWGQTPQYSGLESLYKELKDKGFVVLGFPSNDFGGQEPGSPKEIRDFCTSKYAVSFPMFEKVSVKAGPDQSPLYANLAKQAKGESPNWNFCKYLVAKNGLVYKFYKNSVKPDDAALRKDVETLLAVK